MLHYDIRLSGNVQGVGLRYASWRKAQALGVFGFVRNERDGTVTLEAEGERAEDFLVWLKEEFGDQVQLEAKSGKRSGYKDFQIKFDP